MVKYTNGRTSDLNREGISRRQSIEGGERKFHLKIRALRAAHDALLRMNDVPSTNKNGISAFNRDSEEETSSPHKLCVKLAKRPKNAPILTLRSRSS